MSRQVASAPRLALAVIAISLSISVVGLAAGVQLQLNTPSDGVRSGQLRTAPVSLKLHPVGHVNWT
jgi:hypothetical protein